MGAFLDKPRTEKTNECGQGAGLRYGIAAMQGWRIEMEDAHTARAGPEMPVPWDNWSFFAVFDGHAGNKVARYASGHLLDAILNSSAMQELAKQLPLDTKLDSKQLDAVTRSMKAAFLKLDQNMRGSPDLHGENERSGSTAVCTLVAPSHVFIANLGDSRALISRNGCVHFATEDHKPYLPKERDRIINAGGSVMIQRVNGSLAVSRALGDYEYKSVPGLGACFQLVSPEPDVNVMERDSDGKDEFMILACDGIFDVMTNQELCDFIRSRLRVTDRLDLICNQVLDSCLSKGSKDNMSIVLVTFAGAPKVCSEAVDKERELESRLRIRIESMVNVCDNEEELDAENVLRLLINSEMPDVPPGAGLHAMRPLVESILESLLAKRRSISTPDHGHPQVHQQPRQDIASETAPIAVPSPSPLHSPTAAASSPSPPSRLSPQISPVVAKSPPPLATEDTGPP